MMRIPTISVLSLAIGFSLAQNILGSDKKTITIIRAESTADGSTSIGREATKECIVTLPKAESLDPDVTADSKYLKEINGEKGKNEWVRVYSAKLTVNYMVNRNDLLIVTNKSIEAKDPTMKDVEKYLPRSQEFYSNSANGDTYGGRSHRQYYFSKPEDAAKDVRSQVLVWLKQQTPLLCSESQ